MKLGLHPRDQLLGGLLQGIGLVLQMLQVVIQPIAIISFSACCRSSCRTSSRCCSRRWLAQLRPEARNRGDASKAEAQLSRCAQAMGLQLLVPLLPDSLYCPGTSRLVFQLLVDPALLAFGDASLPQRRASRTASRRLIKMAASALANEKSARAETEGFVSSDSPGSHSAGSNSERQVGS